MHKIIRVEVLLHFHAFVENLIAKLGQLIFRQIVIYLMLYTLLSLLILKAQLHKLISLYKITVSFSFVCLNTGEVMTSEYS